jgi:hypothetical protein
VEFIGKIMAKDVAVGNFDPKGVAQIFYFGDDDNYWQVIQDIYTTTYPEQTFDFKSHFKKREKEILKPFVELLEKKPCVVYVDSSIQGKAHLKLAKMITTNPHFEHTAVVGLVESSEAALVAKSGGFDFIYVKCAEYHDAVYGPYVYTFPASVINPQFAEAKFHRPTKLTEECRIHYVAPTYVRIESDTSLPKGAVLELTCKLPKNFLLSNKFVVTETYTENLYYNKMYGYDLSMTFVDKPEFEEIDPDLDDSAKKMADIDQKQQEASYKSELALCKKKCRQWVTHNASSSEGKKTEVMVVDKEMGILKRLDGSLDTLPYNFRFFKEFSEEMEVILKVRPQLIAYEFYPDPKPLLELTEKDIALGRTEEWAKKQPDKRTDKERFETALSTVSSLIEKVKGVEGYAPFIVVFHSAVFPSNELQTEYKYPLLLSNEQHIDTNLVVELTKMFMEKHEQKMAAAIQKRIVQLRKKDPKKYRMLTPKDFKEERFYIDEWHEMSHSSFQHDIEVETMTESELTFQTDQDLALGNFIMTLPIDMGVHIIPADDGRSCEVIDGRNVYRALIHSTNETRKKKIRQFVNEIFFADVNEKRRVEQEQFESKKKEAMQNRMTQVLEDDVGDAEMDDSSFVSTADSQHSEGEETP